MELARTSLLESGQRLIGDRKYSTIRLPTKKARSTNKGERRTSPSSGWRAFRADVRASHTGRRDRWGVPGPPHRLIHPMGEKLS